MNCDEVFAILTRGPFPTGDRCDRLVQAHLESCVDCRRLAEALRPNDECHREEIAPEDSLALPGYWGGRLQAESRPTVSLTQMPGKLPPQRNAWQSAPAASRGRGINLWQFTTAVALGIVMAAVLRTLVGPAEQPPPPLARGDNYTTTTRGLHHAADGNYPASPAKLPPYLCVHASSPSTLWQDEHDSSSVYKSAASTGLTTRCTQCHLAGGEKISDR